ncbi:hypothetical protein POJ06DRAFT_269373 [Lipomyces tetrasporus]|uniref:Pentatricopeptide repeat protein n=1 Tax=Lipomyces tetrasporus TaxID=54092 RepID=A0AAD7QPP7_9ASCO|nr:uncharacterized protein POJ06DRAFT_269373 [Lipomyces tetrasporus]KAJ8099312.1 hypothetical protein POJ06DRAFT_269373 [Lipomyces tetrasporus]
MRTIKAASVTFRISTRYSRCRHATALVAAGGRKLYSQITPHNEFRGERNRDVKDKYTPSVSRDLLWKDGTEYDIDETASMYLRNKKLRRNDDDNLSSLDFMRRHFQKKGLRNKARRPSVDPLFVPKLNPEHTAKKQDGTLFELDETWETIRLRMHTYIVERKYDSVFRLANAIVKADMVPPMWIYSEVVFAMVKVGGKGGFLAPTIMMLVDELLLRGKAINRHMFHQLFKLVGKSPDPTVRHGVVSLAESQNFDLQEQDWMRMIQSYLLSNEFEMALRTMDKMTEENLPIPHSAYKMMIEHLLDMGEFELAYKYMMDRMETRGLPNEEHWGALLSLAAREFRYDMVAQIWEDIVELDYVIPDDGTCINIVMTAARHADPLLCANALRILVARGVQSEFLASCMASAYENRQNLESRNATSEIVEEDRKELQPGGSMIPEERLRSWGADWE